MNDHTKSALDAAIREALRSSKNEIPPIDRLVFWSDGRWSFMNEDHEHPPLQDSNTSIFERAVDLVDDEFGLPFVYQWRNFDSNDE